MSPPMKKTISGLYAVTPDLNDTALLLERVRAALAGGVGWVQYRNKIADERLRRVQAGALQALCRRSGAALIINDHVELARYSDADGVHVGGDDASIADARAKLGDDKIIGASCYNSLARAQTAAAQGADYVAFGSFFASSVKPGAVRAPLTLLREAQRQTTLPVVAIGGIRLDNAPQLILAGADAIAVISALFNAPDVAAAAREFGRLFDLKTG
jgi:thiamine-phosphate pyrophosphorylase